jgi:ATP-dependent DNA helicase RecQ
LISQLNSGDELTIDGECCLNLKGAPVLKFSKLCSNQIEGLMQKNYVLTNAKIRFIVYWKKKDSTEDEIKIILPEINFERKT